MIESFDNNARLVLDWGNDKGFVRADNSKPQFIKAVEEFGELAKEVNKGDIEAAKDEMGDVFVTLILTAACLGFTAAEALEFAYNKIKNRKGVVVNGVFIKESK